MGLDEKQKVLIEKFGIYFEESGLQPAASRVMALLFVSDKSEITFDEIREDLSMSKSAISNAINLLLTMKQIEYMTKSGDRKRYFRNKIDNWVDAMKDGQNKTIIFKDLLAELLEIHKSNDHPKAHKYAEIIDFLEYLKVEFPVLIDRWKKKRKL